MMTRFHRLTPLMAGLLAATLALAGCPANDDDDSAAGDDDTAADPSPPEISNLAIEIGVPDGESDEMLILTFDFDDVDGDIRGGEIWLFTSTDEGVDDTDYAGRVTLGDVEDATSGSLQLYDDIGGDSGFQPGVHYWFGVKLVDRELLESNMLEGDFEIPAE
jgi:hypothetical protein